MWVTSIALLRYSTKCLRTSVDSPHIYPGTPTDRNTESTCVCTKWLVPCLRTPTTMAHCKTRQCGILGRLQNMSVSPATMGTNNYALKIFAKRFWYGISNFLRNIAILDVLNFRCDSHKRTERWTGSLKSHILVWYMLLSRNAMSWWNGVFRKGYGISYKLPRWHGDISKWSTPIITLGLSRTD